MSSPQQTNSLLVISSTTASAGLSAHHARCPPCGGRTPATRWPRCRPRPARARSLLMNNGTHALSRSLLIKTGHMHCLVKKEGKVSTQRKGSAFMSDHEARPLSGCARATPTATRARPQRSSLRCEAHNRASGRPASSVGIKICRAGASSAWGGRERERKRA